MWRLVADFSESRNWKSKEDSMQCVYGIIINLLKLVYELLYSILVPEKAAMSLYFWLQNE